MEERSTMSQCNEMNAVIVILKANCIHQLDTLFESRHATEYKLQQLEVSLDHWSHTVHESRVKLQSLITANVVAQLRMDQEHRSTASWMFYGEEGECNRDGLRGGFLSKFDSILEVIEAVRSKATELIALSDVHSSKRKCQVSQQHAQDEEVEKTGNDVSQKWMQLVSDFSNFTDESKKVQDQHVELFAEDSKLQVEHELLQKTSEQFTVKRCQLEKNNKRVALEAEHVHAAHGKAQQQFLYFQQEHAKWAKQLKELLNLQSDLRYQQEAHFVEARQLDVRKLKLHGMTVSQVPTL